MANRALLIPHAPLPTRTPCLQDVSQGSAPVGVPLVVSTVFGEPPVAALALGTLVVACARRAPNVVRRAKAKASRGAVKDVTGTAGAKAKVATQKSSSAPKKKVVFDPALEVGAFPFYFDPLGFSKAGDKRAFYEYRVQELKHGRVAMLAAVGLVIQHFVHFDVDSWDTYVKLSKYGIGAVANFYGPFGFFAGVLPGTVVIGLWESYFGPQLEGREPGDYGDPLGFGMYNDGMRTAELVNGRFAMISCTGIFAAELATGKDAVEQLGLGL